jgi:hypothetical protein
MADFNNDYLRYDSNSVKRIIIQKLSENPNFTDQIFEDSNLSTLVDVFAFMFDTLSYYTNHGASEAMFNDSQIYENLNRIVKMLGYNPLGYITSQIDSIFYSFPTTDTVSFIQLLLPKYTNVNTNLVDSNGNVVYYSLTNQIFLTPTDGKLPQITDETAIMTNGRWKLYPSTFTSTGIPFESFKMVSITLDVEDAPRYVSHPNIDVYIKRANSTIGGFDYIPYSPIAQGTLFGEQTIIYGPTDNVFELRLDENKQYNITFGDGVHGSRLVTGDEIYIIYLEGNGSEADLATSYLGEANVVSVGVAGMSDALFAEILGMTITDLNSLKSSINPTNGDASIFINNTSQSTIAVGTETVDEMRETAPNWFRMGDRLITAQDFEQYVETIFKGDVIDTHVMNNWEYLSHFLQWLDANDSLTIDIREREYPYADSCDFNNVYIWTKFKSASVSSDIIENDLISRKVLTAEPLVLTALDVNFVPCLVDNAYDITDWDANVENYIEVLKDKNSFISVEKIREEVVLTIRDYFNAEDLKLGQNIDLRELQSQLLAIDGVSQIRTAYRPLHTTTSDPVGCEDVKYFDGLSFAYWTPSLVNGKDLEVINGNVQMRNFQFPRLLDLQFFRADERIKVVYEAFGSPSVEY